MDEKVSTSNASSAQSATEMEKTTTETATQAQAAQPSAERAGTEHRQAYGTAKTENLRDSGLWRILLPGFLLLCFLALLAIPLFILIPLLTNSILGMRAGNAQEAQLLWLWITMIVVEIGAAALIIWGISRVFMTQAGNYKRQS
jgi:hypothetical protein